MDYFGSFMLTALTCYGIRSKCIVRDGLTLVVLGGGSNDWRLRSICQLDTAMCRNMKRIGLCV